MSAIENIGAGVARQDSGRGILQEGRYGPRSDLELDVRIGALAQGALDTESGLISLGKGGLALGAAVMGKVPSTSGAVFGGFGPLCSLFAGMQPLETGMKLYRDSKGGLGAPEDVWGMRRGVSKMVTGAAFVFGAFFKLFSRVISLALRVGAQMTPELVVFGTAAGMIGLGFSLTVPVSMIVFCVISIVEGHSVRKEVQEIVKGAADSEGALAALRDRLRRDPLFERRLKRTTKKKVFDEIMLGKMSEKSRKHVEMKKEAIDPAGAILQHVFMKLDKRAKLYKGLIALGAFSMAIAVAGLFVSAGAPLIVLTVLGIVSTLMWLAIDAPAFVKVLKSGEYGRADRAVIVVTTVLLVGLIVVSGLVSTGLVGFVVMATLGVICVGLQLMALRAARPLSVQEEPQVATA